MRGKGILLTDAYTLQVQPVRETPTGLIIAGLQVGNTLYQNQALLLLLQPGQIKTAPLVGTGIENALLAHDLADWRRRIRLQLELDGQRVKSVVFTPKTLQIDASYSS